MKRRIIFETILIILAIIIVSPCWGLDQIVEKKEFYLKEFTLVSGKKISPVRIGYETYGTLAPTKDNVILICHFFSGDSHAAGKYSPEDKFPGYWDAIIGPDKILDTNKYFIVSSDTLCNLNTKNPKVITTGPASINPETGKPYGMTFPIVQIRDFVNLQYELLKSLGVKKLKAVIGASMGGIQAIEWAVTYPDFVERIIPVIAAHKLYGWTLGWGKLWTDPIKLDPKWNNGDYYGKEEPIDGLTYAFMIITLSARWADWMDKSFDRKWADPNKSPYDSMDNLFLAEAALYQAALARAKISDANSVLYLGKANALHDITYGYGSLEEALKRIKAKVLMIPADTDILLPPYQSQEFVEALQKLGKDARLFEIKTKQGHVGGLLEITKAADMIVKFLEE